MFKYKLSFVIIYLSQGSADWSKDQRPVCPVCSCSAQWSSPVIQSNVSSLMYPAQCIQPSVSSSAQWTCSQPNERLYISMWTRFPVDILHFSVWTTTKNASFVCSTFPSQSEEVLMAAPSCATYIQLCYIYTVVLHTYNCATYNCAISFLCYIVVLFPGSR